MLNIFFCQLRPGILDARLSPISETLMELHRRGPKGVEEMVLGWLSL
jgi:hypothetical protein